MPSEFTSRTFQDKANPLEGKLRLFSLDTALAICHIYGAMNLYSTTQAAKRLGIEPKTLSRYIAAKKVPAPQFLHSGKITHHIWTEAEVEELRKLLPKIANGRKTRYQKKHSALSNQQSAKTKSRPKKPKRGKN